MIKIYNFSLDDYKNFFKIDNKNNKLAIIKCSSIKHKDTKGLILKNCQTKSIYPIFNKQTSELYDWQCNKVLKVYDLNEEKKHHTPDSFFKYIYCELKKYQIKYE